MTRRPHVVFVDDEPRILSGLRRMLRTHRDQWDMSFVEGGQAALETLHSRHCDVIVTDYRMPGMDGAELLERVRTEFPAMARVILSGQTNEDNLLKIMVLAHEFINKPSSPDQIIAAVERLISFSPTASDEAVRRDVAVIESLPSPPHTLIELTAALGAEDASAQSVGQILERDPAVAAKVLHLVNSSAYTMGRKVNGVVQATALLGVATVRGLVLMHDLVRTFDPGGVLPAAWIETLTVHAVGTSRLAGRLAAGREWEGHAFTAGLLHEVGQLVLASSRPAEFAGVLAAWRDTPGTPLCELESGAFGVDHREIGSRLLRLWSLPEPVIEAASAHQGPPAPTDVTDPTSAVALAHHLVEAEHETVCGPYAEPEPFDEEALAPPVREAISRWRRERSPR
ncbi:two-component system response regulator [Actinoplanes sp. NBRC 14428]|uniref:HD-like signal output (HDOD) protein n=1 Tax=Pseudosporangium ferrugineum TaxID=439699 RepID=A0A2T0SFL7_9ACTN|nr:response regulator [Pseudosporangium ferrugineum]PRY32204.1 HD-like signal output (HDOD) protein [Pseudosporangium ferrugineum]BCJ49551.1 two-component system response regulator [Actinoplanes sp. NBRC 14428]